VWELGLNVGAKSREAGWLQTLHVLVNRVYEYGERHVALELRRRTAENEVCALLGSKANLLEQACLADTGLADQLDDAWPSSIHIVQDALDAAELVQASDELVGG